MSAIKRYIEEKVTEIADASGYEWDFIMDMAMEFFEDEGYIDWDYIEGVSMEHDW